MHEEWPSGLKVFKRAVHRLNIEWRDVISDKRFRNCNRKSGAAKTDGAKCEIRLVEMSDRLRCIFDLMSHEGQPDDVVAAFSHARNALDVVAYHGVHITSHSGRTCDRRRQTDKRCISKEKARACRMRWQPRLVLHSPPCTDSGRDRFKWSSDFGQGHQRRSSGDPKRIQASGSDTAK
jgi:hypothetical protein